MIEIYGKAVYTYWVEFIESPLFSKRVTEYLTDDEYSLLQWELVTRPEVGSLIPNSGGLRKIRWQGHGKGKSGGYRIIYYWQVSKHEIWLLTIYAKNEESTIPPHILKELKKRFEHG